MSSRIRQILVLVAASALLGCIPIFLIATMGIGGSIEWFKDHVYWPIFWPILQRTILSPVFFGVITLILILERLFPVNPNQKIFSVGFMHDSVWLILALLFEGLVIGAYTKALKDFFAHHVHLVDPSLFGNLPEMTRFAIGVLVSDFLAWFQHYVKHKVPWLWHIHAVHHSQTEINMFTDLRFHFMEYIISRILVVVPLTIMGISTPYIAAYAVFNTWYTRLYHANIKSNFGFLRYIFVTPQSHRVHHSIEERHRDKNFGVIFSFWDRIFKTQHENCHEYPETGIADSTFPLEKETSLLSLIMTPIQQHIYPFAAMARSLKEPKNNKNKSGDHERPMG